MGKFTFPNGATYETGDPVNVNGVVEKEGTKPDMANVNRSARPGTVGASMEQGRENLAKSAELETQAYKWEQLIAKNHYLDHEVRDHYRSRIASARREAAILRGEPFPDPVPDQPVSKTVSLTLPR